jgi:hypothetical protein
MDTVFGQSELGDLRAESVQYVDSIVGVCSQSQSGPRHLFMRIRIRAVLLNNGGQ